MDVDERVPADRTRVDLSEQWERRYWMLQLGCSEARLRTAVRAVGSSVEAVREHLRAATPQRRRRTRVTPLARIMAMRR
jgi:hypothetical protein